MGGLQREDEMPGISGFLFRMWDPINSVTEKIQEWSPRQQYSSEAECEKALTEYLIKCFPGLSIRNQFPYDRVKADIVIEKTVAIEIKFSLKSGNEFNRLLGQIDHYGDWGIGLIVVVFGNIPKDYTHRIQKKLDQLWGEDCSAFIHKSF